MCIIYEAGLYALWEQMFSVIRMFYSGCLLWFQSFRKQKKMCIVLFSHTLRQTKRAEQNY